MAGNHGDSTGDVGGGLPPGGEGSSPPHDAGTTAPMPRWMFVGQRIGAYGVLEVLGEGGFGIVFLAERREPMVQRVAIKVLRPGHDSQDVVARFEQERQLLAVLDHPNIAKVFDAGETGDGRPYFVMELVRGDWITRFANRRGLTRDERLELFLPVCDAMQHAHRRGVVHRDLKPGNILVAEDNDASATPKVIDFGIAKALAGHLTDKPLTTRAGGAIGSPDYMSPEQALGAEIDASSDVYGLCAVLYELLTGKTPLEHMKLREVPTQMLGVTVAGGVVRNPRAVTPDLPDELEAILLRGLCVDRTRRYADAGGLGDDLRRYLAGEPVWAKRDSVWYRAQTTAKVMVAHNKAASVLLAWAIGVLVSYFVLGTLLFWIGWPAAMTQRALLWARGRVYPDGPPLVDVRVVEFAPDTPPSEIAVRAGISGVVDGNFQSERRLYGAMIGRAARAGAAVVLVDAFFSADSPHDVAISEAINECERAGTRLVFSCSSWPVPAGQAPRLAGAVVRQLDKGPRAPTFGGARLQWLGDRDDSDMVADLAILPRAGGGLAVHTAVLAMGAYRRPDCGVEVRMDQARARLLLNYWRGEANAARVVQPGQDQVPLSDAEELHEVAENERVLQVGDVPALMPVRAPPAVSAAAIWPLSRAMAATDPELRTWASGRVLVIGDARLDLHKVRGGRVVPGPELVASAVQELLRLANGSTASLRVLGEASDFFIAASIGMVAVFLGGGRTISLMRTLISIALMCGAIFVGFVALYCVVGIFVNPLVPMVTAGVCLAGAAWVSWVWAGVPRLHSVGLVRAGSMSAQHKT